MAVFSALLAFGGVDAALAQAPPPLPVAGGPPAGPPLIVPNGGPPAAGIDAIPFNSWLLYPSLTVSSQYSDNYFLSSTAKLSGVGFGVTPSLTGLWSDGIHTTTLYGYFQGRDYPTENEINATDGEVTFSQKYAPLRDLSFTVLGDYTHLTIANGLNYAIPGPVATPGPIILANGNTVLPNGTIVSPSGQIVGQQAVSPLVVNGLSVVNPSDQYTATAKVEKIFSDGILTLGASVIRLDYEELSSHSLDFTANTFTEDAAFWLGPVFYAYSDGAFAIDTNTFPNPNSTAYSVVGGIGTRQIGLFRASAYFGYQATEAAGGSGSAGGDVYGGALAYYPIPNWSISANFDKTINISSITTPSVQALTISGLTPVLFPVSASTDITATTLRSNYRISPQWQVSGTFGYTQALYIGSPIVENIWLADAILRYDIWRNMTLTLEYQYASIVSNAPFTSANRNFINMTAQYRF